MVLEQGAIPGCGWEQEPRVRAGDERDPVLWDAAVYQRQCPAPCALVSLTKTRLKFFDQQFTLFLCWKPTF